MLQAGTVLGAPDTDRKLLFSGLHVLCAVREVGGGLQPGVGQLRDGTELVESLDEHRAAATRRVEDAQALELFPPRFPETDEGLAPLLDARAQREERWLRQQFPEYAAYQQRVRRFIPWIY